jgi:hypothetical protein
MIDARAAPAPLARFTSCAAYRTWCQLGGFSRKQNQLDFCSNLEHMGFAVYRANMGSLALGIMLKD